VVDCITKARILGTVIKSLPELQPQVMGCNAGQRPSYELMNALATLGWTETSSILQCDIVICAPFHGVCIRAII
jgi:hypothetical protein